MDLWGCFESKLHYIIFFLQNFVYFQEYEKSKIWGISLTARLQHADIAGKGRIDCCDFAFFPL